MPTPQSISTFFKAASALALGLSLLSSTAHARQTPTITQPDRAVTSAILITQNAFTPPKNSRSRSPSRTTTGTRQGSCLSDTETAFTLFGPDAVLGQTTATRPAFVWHLPPSETAFPVTFRLLEPDEAGIPTLIHSEVLPYASGFTTYQLPTTVAPLSPNKEYRWQVVIECNPNYPSRSLSQELAFEVVPAPPGLLQTLSTATTASEKALAYGQSGLWYDAIAQVAQAQTPAAIAARTKLLSDLASDLAALEQSDEQLSQDILTIAEMTAR